MGWTGLDWIGLGLYAYKIVRQQRAYHSVPTDINPNGEIFLFKTIVDNAFDTGSEMLLLIRHAKHNANHFRHVQKRKFIRYYGIHVVAAETSKLPQCGRVSHVLS